MVSLTELYKSHNVSIDLLEKEQDLIKLKIGTFMGEAETMVDNKGQTLATFRNQTSNRVDTKKIREDGLFDKYSKESTSRVMRFVNKGDF